MKTKSSNPVSASFTHSGTDIAFSETCLRSMRLRSCSIDCVRISISGRWGLSELTQLWGIWTKWTGIAQLSRVWFRILTCRPRCSSLRFFPWRSGEHIRRFPPLLILAVRHQSIFPKGSVDTVGICICISALWELLPVVSSSDVVGLSNLFSISFQLS